MVRMQHRDTLALYLSREFGPLPVPSQIGSAEYPISFVPLTQGLLDQKAWVHSRTWRQTYAGLLPGPLLQLVSPDFARNVTARLGVSHPILALAGRRVIGYAEWVDRPRPPFVDPAGRPAAAGETAAGDPSADGQAAQGIEPPVELAAIYLLRDYQHRGIGTRLFEALRKAAGSPRRMMLWVFDRNTSARRFYRRLGFRPTAQRQEEDGGQITEQAWLLG